LEKAKPSIRAKWRSFLSARGSALKKNLTPPTLSEMQLHVLRLGLLQDGNVWIGVFPQCEELLVCSTAFAVSPSSGNSLLLDLVGFRPEIDTSYTGRRQRSIAGTANGYSQLVKCCPYRDLTGTHFVPPSQMRRERLSGLGI